MIAPDPLRVLMIVAAACNVIAMVLNLHQWRRQRTQWRLMGVVRNVPGQGARLFMPHAELPPAGTYLWMRIGHRAM